MVVQLGVIIYNIVIGGSYMRPVNFWKIYSYLSILWVTMVVVR
jgi:hypothetical protein